MRAAIMSIPQVVSSTFAIGDKVWVASVDIILVYPRVEAFLGRLSIARAVSSGVSSRAYVLAVAYFKWLSLVVSFGTSPCANLVFVIIPICEVARCRY